MNKCSIIRRCLPLVVLLGLGAASCAEQSTPDSQEVPIVYLVRHAEKADDGTSDPPLTEAGTARSELLSHMLSDAGLDHLHTTDFLRTRRTLAPLESALGFEARIYEAGNAEALGQFADYLKATPGRHLVVGHSNTTPALVELLGGDPGSPILETEYDRLYIMILSPTGRPTSLLLRFGH